MAKRSPKKDSEYLRFRPYRAFAAQPTKSPNVDRWTLFWRIVMVVGALGLLFAAALSIRK